MNKQVKKKKTAWKQYIMMGFFMIIGAICGVLIVSQSGIKDVPISEFFVIFGIGVIDIYIAVYFQTIIHEAGHLLFGMISGYSFSSFRIGNLMWIKNDNKINFKRMTIAGTGGQCLMIPPEMVDGKIPFILYNLGGSFLNILSGLICWGGYVLCKNVPVVSIFLLLLSIIGFALALINGIPMRLGVVDNDGYNAFSLGKSKEAMRSFWVQLKANQQLLEGTRLKDLPNDWFFMPSDEGMKNSITATMGVFYANQLLDFHNFTETEIHIDKLLSMETAIIGLHRNLLVCDKIYCELVTKNNIDNINEILDKNQKQFMKQMKKFPSVLRTQYTVALLLENDNDEAKRILEQFNKCSKTYPYKGDVESELELIEKAEQVYMEKSNIVV